MSKGIDGVREIRNVQANSGNWDYNEYMWGLYNGIELALAIMEDREPVFKDKPKHYISDKTTDEKVEESWFDRLHKAWGKR